MSTEQQPRNGPLQGARSDTPVAPSIPGPLAQPEWTRLQHTSKKGDLTLDKYAAKRIDAGALLVAKRRWHGASVRIRMTYPPDRVASVQPEFEKALWRARAIERQSRLVVGGPPSKILTEMLFSVIVYMLGVLDSVEGMPLHPPSGDNATGFTRDQRIANAVKIAEAELVRLQEFASEAELRSALKRYVLGPVSYTHLTLPTTPYV